MKLLVTGGSGLIGKKILASCEELRINANFLTTRKKKLSQLRNHKGFYWDPKSGEIDEACFEGVDILIHLAGASISKTWTPKNKKEILESRVNGSRLLRKVLDEKNIRLRNIICASAIGIYSHSLEETYDENSPLVVKNFLQKVTSEWEVESQAMSNYTEHLSIFRIGLVLAKNGGLLSQLILPIKLFLGTAFATGKQWQSWIHIEDLSRLFFTAIDKSWEGTYNAVSPNPVPQKNFIKAIGNALGTTVFLPNIPTLFLKMVLGERSILILGSQKVSADSILSKGFVFKFPLLSQALDDLIKKKE